MTMLCRNGIRKVSRSPRRAAEVFEELEEALAHLGVHAPGVLGRGLQLGDDVAQIAHLVAGDAVVDRRLVFLLRGLVAVASRLEPTQEVGPALSPITRRTHRSPPFG